MFLKKCDNRLVHHCVHGLAINAFRVFANLFKFLAKRLRASEVDDENVIIFSQESRKEGTLHDDHLT